MIKRKTTTTFIEEVKNLVGDEYELVGEIKIRNGHAVF